MSSQEIKTQLRDVRNKVTNAAADLEQRWKTVSNTKPHRRDEVRVIYNDIMKLMKANNFWLTVLMKAVTDQREDVNACDRVVTEITGMTDVLRDLEQTDATNKAQLQSHLEAPAQPGGKGPRQSGGRRRTGRRLRPG